ncbi:substrate-binding domain-containing protein [Actinopolymorpha sp. B11F2]|uniref:substrate-binding domain-containing protein n=1 Tax=Actinopolymorpha sp. B11F2 TaxID=3160862 RepID=UPI0032E4EA7D
MSVAFVQKLQGIPYFEAMNAGGAKAAKEIGLRWIYKGGTTADPGAQTDIVKALIQQRVDVLVVAPNDPDSLAPVLQQAKDRGIHVMTSDTDAPNSVREVFVNQATADGIGTAIIDSLAVARPRRGSRRRSIVPPSGNPSYRCACWRSPSCSSSCRDAAGSTCRWAPSSVWRGWCSASVSACGACLC